MSISSVANVLCRTEVLESEKFTFVWEIPDFSLRSEEKGEFLISHEFSINGPGNKITKGSPKKIVNFKDIVIKGG